MIHKEGYKTIANTIIFLIILNTISYLYLNSYSIIVVVLSLILLVIVLQFFRNPDRHTVAKSNQIIAPVDGKVVIVKEAVETEFFKDKRLQISIFMSPLNVHVTRYPMSGKILFSKYHPGKFLFAWNPKSSTDNERTTIVLEGKKHKILYRQVAGFLARRIVNYAKEGKKSVVGKDGGFIKFGSRVDLYLPLDTKILVKEGDVTKGGEDVIAELS